MSEPHLFPPSICGLKEAAEICGLSMQAFMQRLKKQNDLPIFAILGSRHYYRPLDVWYWHLRVEAKVQAFKESLHEGSQKATIPIPDLVNWRKVPKIKNLANTSKNHLKGTRND